MKAMILAAGEGTRLRPLTYSVPKPMVPILGKPLLAWTLSWLASQGITEAVINLYHRPQAIPDFFGREFAGVRLHYSFEDELRGTAGGVKSVASLLEDEPFFVIYGDNLISVDLGRLTAFHAEHKGAAATLALFHHPNPSAAGIVATNSTGRIMRFVEKPPPNQIFADTASAEIYLLDPSVLLAIPATGASDFGRDVFPELLKQDRALYGLLIGGYQDTGTPDQYRQANWDSLASRIGNDCAEKDTWTGPDTRIHPTAVLQGRNVLGTNVIVDQGATLTDCILWDGARIGARVTLENAVVGTNAVIAADTFHSPGAVIA